MARTTSSTPACFRACSSSSAGERHQWPDSPGGTRQGWQTALRLAWANCCMCHLLLHPRWTQINATPGLITQAAPGCTRQAGCHMARNPCCICGEGWRECAPTHCRHPSRPKTTQNPQHRDMWFPGPRIYNDPRHPVLAHYDIKLIASCILDISVSPSWRVWAAGCDNGGGKYLYLVNDHGLVRKVHDGLGNSQRKGPQARAIATDENKRLHLGASLVRKL
jgi:hypothetical protein